MASIRLVGIAAIVLVATAGVAQALQCRQIVRSTFLEIRHPNGAVTMGRVNEGERFIAYCAPEGSRIWCTITETERTVFTVRRFLEADRLEWGHSQVIAFDACLSD
jgi:hypothetical protein